MTDDIMTFLAVEEWRRRLGLDEWHVHAARIRAARPSTRPGREHDRQTGRTTKGLLEALVRCRFEGHGTLAVEGAHSSRTMAIFRMAESLATRLHVPVVVRTYNSARGVPGVTVYRDHA